MQQTIEQVPAMWFIAFTIDIILGSLCFYITIKKPVRSSFEGLFWWFGWWSCLDAIALVMNATMGVDNFWSYHQMGIFIDTAINAGLLVYIIKALMTNWAMNDDDWAKVEKISTEAKVRELQK